MKLNRRIIIPIILFFFFLNVFNSLRTESKTESMTNAKTSSKTEAKTSIFSYDFLSIMKKKMKLMKEKERLKEEMQANNSNIRSDTNAAAPQVPGQGNQQVHSAPISQSNTEQTQSTNDKNKRIIFEGWVKYFKFEDTDGTTKPSAFFKNDFFMEQYKLNPNLDLKSKENIPDETHFWLSLFKNSLNISASKQLSSTKVIDVLNLELISPVLEGRGFNGGIIDFGSFSEGACFKLSLTNHNTWIICTDSDQDKKQLMEEIKELKLLLQRANGDIVTRSEPKKEESLEGLFNGRKEDDGLAKKSSDPTDGYWIVLQDWTMCSKKCDGGTSTLHRLCVPAKNGGKPCVGEGVMTKSCNTQPCPKVFSNDSNPNSPGNTLQQAAKPVTLKPIVKVLPYTNRPQRYHKCVIKESDLMMTKEQEGDYYHPQSGNKGNPIQIPVRAVLNDRTISFYENADDYSSHFVAYNLKTSNFLRSSRDKNCFVITENTKRTELCPFGIDKEGKTFNEWAQDFNLFKLNCEKKLDTVDAELENELKEKMKEAKRQVLANREEMIKEKIRQKDKDGEFNVIKQTNQAAQQALLKEENLEELIEQEEKERELKEERNIEIQIEEEKKKNECILKAIKEREIENQYQAQNIETEKQVEEIKKEAMNQVIAKRNKLKEKIAEMRKKAKRRENRMKQKLMTVRLSMAKEMNNMYKDGDQNKCQAAMKDPNTRLSYCQTNFDDIAKFSECKDDEDFCSICCENEFGGMHIDKRNKCMKDLCDQKPVTQDTPKGKWIWSVGVKK